MEKTINGRDYRVISETEIIGDLIFENENLFFENPIEISGKIKAKNIFTYKNIKAGEGINAGGDINAGWGISAKFIFSFSFSVKCKFLKTSLLPFGREYYADLFILKKYSTQILDEKNCWKDFKKMISKKEAQKICKWNGWHWLLRAQLEMFFGLKEKIDLKENKNGLNQ